MRCVCTECSGVKYDQASIVTLENIQKRRMWFSDTIHRDMVVVAEIVFKSRDTVFLFIESNHINNC